MNRLIYVVGPSGAGKDSLINYAKARLKNQPVVFARRYITRAEDGGENHYAISPAEFEARVRRGDFALHWVSHGYRYGIGCDIDVWLNEGLNVVVNGSREHIGEARQRYPDMSVVWVQASLHTLRARLSARGRDDSGAMQRRLERAVRYAVPRAANVISNDGALEVAGARLMDEILGPLLENALTENRT